MVDAMRTQMTHHAIPIFDIGNEGRQGIVHVIGPELGLSLPGTSIVCADSHTCTHGAMGALAFGIGSTEVVHVLATQTIRQKRPKTMRVRFDGRVREGVTAKDMILYVIGRIGAAGGTGLCGRICGRGGRRTVDGRAPHAVQPEHRTGRQVRPRRARRDDLRVSARQAICAAAATQFDAALADWKALATDEGAQFDREVDRRCVRDPRAGHVGHEPRARDRARRRDSRSGVARRTNRADRPRRARSTTWACMRDSISTNSPWIACSSARARTAASRICARPRASSMVIMWRGNVKAWVVPGSLTVARQARRGRARRYLSRGGFRMARAGLLDVRRCEWRCRRAWRALRIDVESQFHRQARAGRAHASGESRSCRGKRDRRAYRRAADAGASR